MTEEGFVLGGRGLVIAEKRGRVNLLWRFLTAVFAVALVRGHLGAATDTARVAIDAGFGLLLAVSIGAWLWFRRHGARLEIAPEVIAFSHRGQSRSTELSRTSGDLYVHTTHLGGTDRLQFLKVTGSDEAIPLQMFDRREVEDACRASGWRFVGDEGGARA